MRKMIERRKKKEIEKTTTIFKMSRSNVKFKEITNNIVSNYKELIFNDLQIIPRERFRCSMMIFKKIINIANPLHNLQSLSLEYCSGYFGLGLDKKKFHDANR